MAPLKVLCTVLAVWVSQTGAFQPSCHPLGSSSRSITFNHVRLFRGGALPALALPTKEHAEAEFIKDALLQNVLFTSLPKPSLDALIQAFEKTTVEKDQVIVKQGDSCEGDYVYLVAEGECTVKVDGKIVPEPYGTLQPKSIFGELGVLYDKQRQATISAKTDSVTLFRIHGQAFKTILNKPTEDTEQLQEIDDAIKQVSGTKYLYGGDIIRQYKPQRLWLWSRWSGTILQQNLVPTLMNMVFSLMFIVLARNVTGQSWGMGLKPDPSHPFIQRLAIIKSIWSYQQGLTTFILTFFVNQAYSFWTDMLGTARRIQGRMNDFHLLLATSAKRKSDGTYLPEAEQVLEDVGQYSRLLHALLWAAQSKRFAVLLTPTGLERMASRGLMTSKQLEVLQSLDLPVTQKHNACLEWMMIRVWKAIDAGLIVGSHATSEHLMSEMAHLRGTYASIGDKLDCRMPLAYTHFVQILVDTFVLSAPIALYSDMGAWSVVCVGVLTLFYTGLLNLAKIFLDPLNNENYCNNSIFMDIGVLIRESNAGSTRWKNAGARVPFKT